MAGKKQKAVGMIIGKRVNQRLLVATAITAGYDVLKEPEAEVRDCDWVCFTDDPSKLERSGKTKTWQVRQFPAGADGLSPVKKTRYVKTHLFCLFPEHKYRFWVDGSITVRGDLCELARKIYSPGKMLYALKHWGRDCLYDEINVIAKIYPDTAETVRAQAEQYASEGFPRHFGLAECGLRFEVGSDYVRKVMETWWAEILRGSYRDQASWAYALWKTDPKKEKLEWLPAKFWESRWFHKSPHKRRK